MQEAGQLARAEPLLHLLLEAADQQHFAQDVLEIALRQGAPLLFDLRHGRSVRFAQWASSSSGTRSNKAWIRSGTTRVSTSRSPTHSSFGALLRCWHRRSLDAWAPRSASPLRAAVRSSDPKRSDEC